MQPTIFNDSTLIPFMMLALHKTQQGGSTIPNPTTVDEQYPCHTILWILLSQGQCSIVQ